MFSTNAVQNIKIYFMSSNLFCQKTWHLSDNVEKCGRVAQATDGNKGHGIWMLDIEDYKHTLIISVLVHSNNGCMKAPECHITRMLPILLLIKLINKNYFIFLLSF